MKHAALLDLQPSNRRLVQDITPRQQPSDMARLSWADQIENGAGMAGLIVWGVSIAALLHILWSTS
jgi:hypothetical protein